jgi:hypothetical protein
VPISPPTVASSVPSFSVSPADSMHLDRYTSVQRSLLFICFPFNLTPYRQKPCRQNTNHITGKDNYKI